MKSKSSLTRQINKIESELQDMRACLKKGWKLYLGDPIHTRIREYENELIKLMIQRNKLNSKLF